MAAPRLSILVPNYNNGRGTAPGDERSDLERLFESLTGTLAHDPTPLEIIVADDGSTDDSLGTCRVWSRRTWRGGEPFCRLLEFPHCGVLSVVANRLTAEACGDLCCRLDGDVEILTRGWASVLCGIFDAAPSAVGIVGAKQLSPQGRVHSAGDWVLHPRGYHHIGRGAERHSVRVAGEVDHVMGCFYGHRRAVWEDLGGYDESILRGQTVDFGLRARLRGWRAVFDPAIEFIHYNSARPPRSTHADSGPGLEEALDRFRRKWGFDRLAPDLDVVADRYAGTPLLWNDAVFGKSAVWPTNAPGPVELADSEWSRFTTDEAFRAAVLRRESVVVQVAERFGERRRVGRPYCRAGLLCHLLARRGVRCIGSDPDERMIRLARSVTARDDYPGPRPEFRVHKRPRDLPYDDDELDTVLLVDVLEHHRNPVGLQREASRVLSDDGLLVVVTGRRSGPFDTPGGAGHPFRPEELRQQMRAAGFFEPVPIRIGTAGPDLLAVVGRKRATAFRSASRSRGAVSGTLTRR